MSSRTTIVAALLLAASCGGEPADAPAARDADSGPLVVVAVNYPLAYMAERIGGAEVDVRLPAPPDVDPAYWQPAAEAIAAMQGADVILLNGAGYAAWVRTATLPASRVVDTSSGFADRLIERADAVTHSHGPEGAHEHGTTEFTTWLDPELAALHAEAIAGSLSADRPEAADDFRARFEALAAELRALDERLAAAVRRAPDRAVIFSHPVYGYLARRYGMNGKSVHWEPDTPATAAQWAELDALVAEHPAEWIIWEAEPLAETVAALQDRGVQSVVFAPCGNRPQTGDLLSRLTDGATALERIYGSD